MEHSLEQFVNSISGAKVYAFADPDRGASTANPLLYKIFGSGDAQHEDPDEAIEAATIVVDYTSPPEEKQGSAEFNILNSLN